MRLAAALALMCICADAAQPPAQPQALQQELTQRYAQVIAACFNGRKITDGSTVVLCYPDHPRRKK